MFKFAVSLQDLFSRILGSVTGPLWRGDRGVTSVEYALLLMLIAMVIFSAVATIGPPLASIFSNPQLP